MRGALLLIVLLWTWLGAAPGAVALASPSEDHVQAFGERHKAVFTNKGPGERLRALEGRRRQPSHGATPYLVPVPPHCALARVESTSAHSNVVVGTLAISPRARPGLPRAPPPARS